MKGLGGRYIWCFGWAVSLALPLSAESPSGDEAVFRALRAQYAQANEFMETQQYGKASQLFRSLINRGQDLGFDRRTYLELSVGLAEALIGLRDVDGAERVLQDLLDLDPPDDVLLRTSLMQARLMADQDRISDAYKRLASLGERVPKDEWVEEDFDFFAWLEKTLNRKWETTLSTAERLFDGGLYDEAIPFYTEVVRAINEDIYPAAQARIEGAVDILIKVRHRLAQAYYMTERFDGVATVLSNLSGRYYAQSTELKQLYLSDLHLLGSAARELKDFRTAVEAFTAYLEYSGLTDHPLENEVRYELGAAYLEDGNLDQAREQFEKLSQTAESSDLYHRSQLFLSKLELVESNYAAVEGRLSRLVRDLAPSDPMRMEASFLRGEAAYEQGQFADAVTHYRASVPNRNAQLADWYPKSLLSLGWSYMRLGEDPTLDREAQESAFDQAESTFSALLDMEPSEEVYLSMAQGYLARGRHFNDPSSFQKVEELLGGDVPFKSLESRASALAIRAEAAQDYASREALYAELTEDVYRDTEAFARAWYLRGLNHFDQAMLEREGKHFSEANRIFDRSLDSFFQAFHLLKEKDRSLAGQLVNLQAQAYLAKGGFEGQFMAFSLYEKLLTQHRDVFTAMRQQDEALYLRGLAAAQMMEYGEAERFASIAEESLSEVVKRWDTGDYAAEALSVLGTVYYKQGRHAEAEETFLTLANHYPYSDKVGDAWYWAAESAENQKKDKNLVRRYRRKVFEEYQHTAHAAEAYFQYYSYADYLQGQGQAMEHLVEMKGRFPNTPFLIVADYLLGLDYKGHLSLGDRGLQQQQDYQAAIQAFEDTKLHFDFCYEHGLLDTKNLEYFVNVRYRAMAERASAFLDVAEGSVDAKRNIYLEYAEQAYREIVVDFDQGDQPLVAFLHPDETFGSLRDEAEYGLAQVYLQGGHEAEGREVLIGLAARYGSEPGARGYYLSRALNDLGRMSRDAGHYEMAINLLQRAEDAGRDGIITSDQQLNLWLLQADCYRCERDLERSMTYLSKIVSEDATSPIRLQAMYQRAEIYEMQGRHELAIKQLEATASKGGEWAYKAKEKLENDYGFN